MTTNYTPEQLELVRTALRLRASVSYAAIKKVKTMLTCVGPRDNRIRGLLNHHGAERTGRSTNSLVQFQNMRRSTLASSEQAYRDICGGISREMLEIVHGSPLEVIASCIRHFVHQACPVCNGTGDGDMELEGFLPCPACGGECESPLLDADYSAIEARIVAWLAGQADVVDQYFQYDAATTTKEKEALCLYRKMASLIFGVPVAEINKFPQRMVGKHARLSCGYAAGPPKFRGIVKKLSGYDLPVGLEEKAVGIYRATNKAIQSYWYDVDRAAKRAILHPGRIFQPDNQKNYVRPEVSFLVKEIGGILFLLIKLPSGRNLAFPKPRLSNDRIFFYGNVQGKANWGEIDTYGGAMVGMITQATAADIMCHGAQNAEDAGYEIAALIHDQALAYHQPHQTPEEFVRLLTDLPSWAAGLPLAAEGALVPFYKKD